MVFSIKVTGPQEIPLSLPRVEGRGKRDVGFSRQRDYLPPSFLNVRHWIGQWILPTIYDQQYIRRKITYRASSYLLWISIGIRHTPFFSPHDHNTHHPTETFRRFDLTVRDESPRLNILQRLKSLRKTYKLFLVSPAHQSTTA